MIGTLAFWFDFLNHGGVFGMGGPFGKASGALLAVLPLFAMVILGVRFTFQDFRKRRSDVLKIHSRSAALGINTLLFSVGLTASMVGLVLLLNCFVPGRPTPTPEKWFRMFSLAYVLQLVDCALSYWATRPNDNAAPGASDSDRS